MGVYGDYIGALRCLCGFFPKLGYLFCGATYKKIIVFGVHIGVLPLQGNYRVPPMYLP